MTKSQKSTLHKRGFALISTIVIVSLLLLVALAMLSLSTVETRSTKAVNVRSEAQANARFALMIAIGKLQETLGPDARATAKSSMLDTNSATNVIDGVAHQHWLGAYPAIDPANPDHGYTDPRSLRDYSLENMEWLVSSKGTADPNDSDRDYITLGQFSEDTLVPSQSLSSLAQAELISFSDNSGRFAWMVTDESMKARIDTVAAQGGSDVLDGVLFTDDDVSNSKYQIVQGTELGNILPGYKDDLTQLDKLLTHNQLTVLDDGTAWENWSRLNQDKFTPYSMSLPVDVANGRLKKDLTAYLKGDYEGLDGISMLDSRFGLTADRETTFDLVKQWSNLVDDNTLPQDVIAPDFGLGENPVQHGLHPLISQGSILIQPSFIILPAQQNDVMKFARIRPVYLFQPQFQINNPHNVDLAAQDYIVQLAYTFSLGMRADGGPDGAKTDKVDFTGVTVTPAVPGKPFDNSFQWNSWETNTNGNIPSLPLHVPADNENIEYQVNNDTIRYFTFVIKDQAIKAGESLMFYAKPPVDGASEAHGLEYNMASDADTQILNAYTSDEDLNLLTNEGNLDEFFYFTLSESIEGTVSKDLRNTDLDKNTLLIASNMTSTTGTNPGQADFNDVDMHLNLYSVDNGQPSLLHTIKKGQANFRNNRNQALTVYPLNQYQSGSRSLITTTVNETALINMGSSILASNYDLFKEGLSGNANKPPLAGQPHAVLGYWNIRNQESYSESADWGANVIGKKWINSFSFREVLFYNETWEAVLNQYNNLSSDRLGGLHLSGIEGMLFPFFDYPTGDIGPFSLGHFQHANLSVYGWQPSYAFGNAQAEPRLNDRGSFKSSSQSELYDNSYILNASVWDSYYLSTIPQDGSITIEPGMRMPNSRQIITNEIPFESDDLINSEGFNRSAANVMIHGGFNVNSTSPTAWKAFLTGLLGQTVQTRLGAVSNSHSKEDSVIAVGRFISPLLAEPEEVTDDRLDLAYEDPSTWASSRTLNASEIDILTNRIVTEVKNRGPFLSLSDFVNRRLSPSEDEADTAEELVYQQVLGTLQAAINKATIEDRVINYHLYEKDNGDINNTGFRTVKKARDWSTINFSNFVSAPSEESMFGHPKSKIDSEGGLIQSYTPMFLSQADILSKIGPSITVRGDTYTVRAYGESLDTNGNVAARAWCEAVVQRSVRPVNWDGTQDDLIQPDLPTESGFGRKFNIISFRWLNEEDVTPEEN